MKWALPKAQGLSSRAEMALQRKIWTLVLKQGEMDIGWQTQQKSTTITELIRVISWARTCTVTPNSVCFLSYYATPLEEETKKEDLNHL